jgi:hypothetical protein
VFFPNAADPLSLVQRAATLLPSVERATMLLFVFESASRPLLDFGVLNDNLIKSLISFVKCINRFLMKNINVFIDISLRVQLWSKWNYMIHMCSQPINNFILKNLCQAVQEKHMAMNINLVQHTWFNTYGLLIIKKELIK